MLPFFSSACKIGLRRRISASARTTFVRATASTYLAFLLDFSPSKQQFPPLGEPQNKRSEIPCDRTCARAGCDVITGSRRASAPANRLARHERWIELSDRGRRFRLPSCPYAGIPPTMGAWMTVTSVSSSARRSSRSIASGVVARTPRAPRADATLSKAIDPSELAMGLPNWRA